MKFSNLVLLVLLSCSSCGRSISEQPYSLSLVMNHEPFEYKIIINLPANLRYRYNQECRYKERDRELELCFVQTFKNEIYITLDAGWNDAGRLLIGKLEGDGAKGIVKYRSYGPYSTVGTFELKRSNG